MSNSEEPKKFPKEKLRPGDWLSIPSISCKDLTGLVLLKPRVFIIVNPMLAVVRSTSLRLPRPW